MSRLALAFVAGLPCLALAYAPNGTLLALDQRPLRVSVEADPQVPGMNAEEVVRDVEAAVRGWDDVSCAVEMDWLGATDVAPNGAIHLRFAALGRTGPPFLDEAPVGPEREVDVRDGVVMRAPDLGIVTVNTDLGLVSEASIAAETCDGGVALSRVVGEIIGIKLGLGYSTWRDSLMARVRPVCQVVRPRPDDVAGLSALYDPYVTLTCEGGDDPLQDGIVGVAPLDVSCSLRVDVASAIDEVVWRWGDGAVTTGEVGRHTYQTADNFDLRVSVEGRHATCGAWSERRDLLAFATACTAPVPDLRVERISGLEFRLVNLSDVSVLGCIDDARWEVRDDTGSPVLEATVWEPRITLPEEGRYTVELRLEGRGGEASREVELDTRVGSPRGYTLGTGCAVAPGASGVWALLGIAGLMVRQRRCGR